MLYRSWSLIPLTISALSLFQQSVLVSGDADFESVRTRLTRDHSGKAGDPPGKYFHESVFDPHYDGRFAEKRLKEDERQLHLAALVQTYLATMADLGAETWLMHGSLMGWWWNRKILPWDDDIDVQMTIDTLGFLANFYNMTVYHYRSPKFPEGKDYMLEINPTYNAIEPDKLNMIDARWIDRDTGLFIDITSVRPNMTARSMGIRGALMCKDKHSYLENQIFPLRDSIFEETPVKIPFDYTNLLQNEYSKESLTKTEYALHEWNQTTMTWERYKGPPRYPKGSPRRGRPSRPIRPPGKG